MFDHISIGVRDAAASKRFYDAALKPLGVKLLSESPGSLGYGTKTVGLWIGETSRPVPADNASGLHFCFASRRFQFGNQRVFVIRWSRGTAKPAKINNAVAEGASSC